ncbi:MAG: hypothetical protein KAX49_18120, partial [Halanaerobiales bacterium]|nr:hypothetical protein [Halanaerobiales bacterium]
SVKSSIERKFYYILAEKYDETEKLVSGDYYYIDKDGKLTGTKTKDVEANKVVRTVFYEYNKNNERTKLSVYYGNIDKFAHDPLYQNALTKDSKWLLSEEIWTYDTQGNVIYYKDPEGYETMTTYVNSPFEINEPSKNDFYQAGKELNRTSEFYNNSVMTNTSIYNLPVGQLQVRKYLDNGNFEASETYFLYNNLGNIKESKTLMKDEFNNDIWVKTKYLDYDQFGNCQKEVIDAESIEPIEITYKYDSNYNSYLTEKTQFISKNIVDDNGNLASPKYVTTKYDYDYLTGIKLKSLIHVAEQ